MRLALVALATLAYSSPAWASCSIYNDTGESWTITSGNTSNQRVGAHTRTSIADGAIVAKSDTKQTVSGTCKPGQSVTIDELREFVKQRLRSSRSPQHVVFRDALPYNETGKLLRRVVREDLSRRAD